MTSHRDALLAQRDKDLFSGKKTVAEHLGTAVLIDTPTLQKPKQPNGLSFNLDESGNIVLRNGTGQTFGTNLTQQDKK